MTRISFIKYDYSFGSVVSLSSFRDSRVREIGVEHGRRNTTTSRCRTTETFIVSAGNSVGGVKRLLGVNSGGILRPSFE